MTKPKARYTLEFSRRWCVRRSGTKVGRLLQLRHSITAVMTATYSPRATDAPCRTIRCVCLCAS